MRPALLDAALATLPALLLAGVTWRVVWPRWKLVGKLLLHPVLYFALALVIGHWSVAVAWVHQAVGLGGHLWFSKKHGFTWYAVEDPDRYVALSKEAVSEWGR
ncbi:MAG: hypothetical protein FJ206_14380 [Gemmatimonadetes bacterium]|nr:hypothetical protein [Gemmatimonadota bacterium]